MKVPFTKSTNAKQYYTFPLMYVSLHTDVLLSLEKTDMVIWKAKILKTARLKECKQLSRS